MPAFKPVIHALTLALVLAIPGTTLGFAAPKGPEPIEFLPRPEVTAAAQTYHPGNDSRGKSDATTSRPIIADHTIVDKATTTPPIQTIGPLAGGYTLTCTMYDMWNGVEEDQEGHLLRCYCAGPYNPYTWSTVHLNEKLGNDNGRFAWYSKDYRGSCNKTILWKERYYMANCLMMNGRVTLAEIDLDLYIRNINGKLEMM
ncbi:hypothetical protein RB595_003480 [Gaeumannomyces hyphopodioides]